MTREGLPEPTQGLTLCGAPAFPGCGGDRGDPVKCLAQGLALRKYLKSFVFFPFSIRQFKLLFFNREHFQAVQKCQEQDLVTVGSPSPILAPARTVNSGICFWGIFSDSLWAQTHKREERGLLCL